MTLRSIITRTATIALAAAALAAPAASARPADMPPAVAKAAAAQEHKQARSTDANGFPTRPIVDRSPANTQSDVTPQAPADPATNWAPIAIGIAGSLLAIGAITGVAGRTRRSGRPRITA